MRIVLPWSGGLGSALALARLRDEGQADVTLLHVTDARTRRDRVAGVPSFLVEEQAACLGVALVLRAADAGDEAAAWREAMRTLAPDAVAPAPGENVHLPTGLAAWGLPWAAPREDAVQEALRRGVRAFVVACRPPLDPSFLGRFVDAELVERMAARGASVLEGGRTFAVDGPGFQRRVDVTAGETRAWDEGWALDLGLRGC